MGAREQHSLNRGNDQRYVRVPTPSTGTDEVPRRYEQVATQFVSSAARSISQPKGSAATPSECASRTLSRCRTRVVPSFPKGAVTSHPDTEAILRVRTADPDHIVAVAQLDPGRVCAATDHRAVHLRPEATSAIDDEAAIFQADNHAVIA